MLDKFMQENKNMFESLILAGTIKHSPGRERSNANTGAKFYSMEGHSKKYVETCCQLANKKIEQIYGVYTPCLDDHQFKK